MRAIDYLYLPYIWGGQDPEKGFDCSGFFVYLFWEFGIIPQGKDLWSQAMYKYFMDKETLDIRKGNLLFYGSNKWEIVHVMMALNKRCCIGAVRGNRWIDTPEKAEQRSARVDVRPINYHLHPIVAICDPFRGLE